ncbi:quinone-dependent dihydroorotate dehydrogenase [Phenylobacterium sp.]|uniref:quinone-dependent dihydroorotate dehydrogenase n=1 Tax=Phenylobacterium sp. TaxID=1871053 RepID=UPI0025DF39D5|nr:quinone-dependent dihydroorotate dehydrogenase [Phenylobacterium sp.]
MNDLHGLATRALHGLDPEDAHSAAIAGLKLGLGPRGPADDPILVTELAGLSLPNPVGLAPGFDKNAEVFGPMLRAGFGFVECGTVTPLAQAGNPRPRLFRLTEDRAVINRMGFNNQGLEAFAARLARRGPGVIGANVGANKQSADRIGDYVIGLTRLWGLASYVTINVSSPNTPGLRALQTKAALDELLGRIVEAATALPAAGRAPVFLKVAPDLEDGEVEAIADTVAAHGLAGVIVSNTTISRPALASAHREETGGLSGAPLLDLSTQMLRRFAAASAGRFVLVGAGGVGSGADAYAKLRAGACAVQLYSALAFEGPGLAVRIKRDLAQRLRADGFRSVSEAVGAR